MYGNDDQNGVRGPDDRPITLYPSGEQEDRRGEENPSYGQRQNTYGGQGYYWNGQQQPPAQGPQNQGQYRHSGGALPGAGQQGPQNYSSNRYEPYNRYNQQQTGAPPQQNTGRAYQGYEYNANTGGWQLEKPTEKYEWDYDKLNSQRDGKKKKNKGMVVFAVSMLCILSICLVAVSGYGIWASMAEPDAGESEGLLPEAEGGLESDSGPDADAPQIQIAGRPEEQYEVMADGKLSIPEVADQVLPSVVGVITYANSQFLQMSGVGSGIIMSDDGYIITNAHVVVGGTAVKIQLLDGSPYDAQIIGYDTQTDLAVLKIEAQDLTPAQFGDSNQIRVGETVVAIGNPASLELAGSVTRGIVSAVNRQINLSNESMSYIQTDAAINPGNSGGALCNEYGQVIGINSNKIIAEGFEGIGFAIPISEAKPILEDIISNGRVTGRVKLGIKGQTVDEVDAKNFGIPMGIQIHEIEPDSDILNKNVQLGDIITQIDGERVYDFADVRAILNMHEVDDAVRLTMYRILNGTEYEISVLLMEDVAAEDYSGYYQE